MLPIEKKSQSQSQSQSSNQHVRRSNVPSPPGDGEEKPRAPEQTTRKRLDSNGQLGTPPPVKIPYRVSSQSTAPSLMAWEYLRPLPIHPRPTNPAPQAEPQMTNHQRGPDEGAEEEQNLPRNSSP